MMTSETGNITNTVVNFNTQRFYRERKNVRLMAARHAVRHDKVVEFYSGVNAMKEIHLTNFHESITNDLDKTAPSDYHMDAMKFATYILPTLGKVDLLDFDAYGNPNQVVAKAFETIDRSSLPFAVVITDGLGLSLKMSPKIDLTKYYLLDSEAKFDRRHPWKHMTYLSGTFLQKLAAQHGWQADITLALRSSNQNFVFITAIISEGDTHE
jgi:tRNA G26 N,N-dimethylase Trm1